jgi:hypothetical protein
VARPISDLSQSAESKRERMQRLRDARKAGVTVPDRRLSKNRVPGQCFAQGCTSPSAPGFKRCNPCRQRVASNKKATWRAKGSHQPIRDISSVPAASDAKWLPLATEVLAALDRPRPWGELGSATSVRGFALRNALAWLEERQLARTIGEGRDVAWVATSAVQ